MIRKIKGIKEDSPSKKKLIHCMCLLTQLFSSSPGTVLSKEALDKMGIGIKSLTKEEEQAKVGHCHQA